jgi:Flp pilus assembly protein protease CpaA
MQVAVLGGVLSVVLILARKMIAFSILRFSKPAGEIPRLLKTGEPAPYGIAIGLSFLMLLWGGHVSGVTLS